MYAGSVGKKLGADTNTHVMSYKFDGASSLIFEDGGVGSVDANPLTNSMNGLTLGAYLTGSVPTNMKIAAVLVYDNLVSDTNYNLIGNFLADTYGTTWTDI